MVARLTTATACIALAGFAALALLQHGAQAQPLPDPMRPPAASAAPSASAPADALQLQSVLVGRGRPPAAVISGELVLLGGRVRDARLVRVGERHVVLRGPDGHTTLRLTPLIPPETTP